MIDRSAAVRRLLACTALSSALLAPAAFAQGASGQAASTGGADVLEEIIVTATRQADFGQPCAAEHHGRDRGDAGAAEHPLCGRPAADRAGAERQRPGRRGAELRHPRHPGDQRRSHDRRLPGRHPASAPLLQRRVPEQRHADADPVRPGAGGGAARAAGHALRRLQPGRHHPLHHAGAQPHRILRPVR